MKKVIVLMSTYNGERWVREQIDSILAQTYANVQLFVRDDGSCDGTPEILQEYEKRGQLTLQRGGNIGCAASFRELLETAGEADYYAFSDQDDVWFEEKIERAVAALDKVPEASGVPALYFSDFDFYDEDLNFISHKKPLCRGLHFLKILCSNTAYGFTIVFNNALRELFLKVSAPMVIYHDRLAVMIASAFGGEIIYDKKPSAKYRRHDENSSITGAGFFRLNAWRVKNILASDRAKLKEQWQVFDSVFAEQLDAETRRKLSWFASDKTRFKHAISKTFYPRRYRETIFDEFAVRLLFLLGRY